MLSVYGAFALRSFVAVAALVLPAFDLAVPQSWQSGGALADPAPVPEKEAFEAAKELGTLGAWNAFLGNYPNGFRADLARAYVAKLQGGGGAAPPPSDASAMTTTSDLHEFPTPAGSWGGIVRDGEGQQYKKLDTLVEGAPVALMGKTETLDNGYPWFKIWFGPEQRKGYMWGGILCSTGAERPDLYKTCPTSTTTAAPPPTGPSAPPAPPKKEARPGCANGQIVIEGKCVWKRDASTFCGPGYRLEGNKCVVGYQAPKPQKQLPTWQQKAIQKGCPKGMDWNAQEGCHEND
jgi:hypothetical protein